MARWTVAVFDDSKEYVSRLMEYAAGECEKGFELVGFFEPDALMEYLDGNRIDILLFSMEGLVEERENRETEYEPFFSHRNVRELVYLGDRRNSKTPLRHINKYQSAGNILSELRNILKEKGGPEDPNGYDAGSSGVDLISVYAPGGENGMSVTAFRIAELQSAKKSVLFVDMDRFSLIPDYLRTETDSSISDLIFFYKTNRQRLGGCLKEKKKRFNNIDFLSAPENMEDMEEIAENEWPDFFREIARCGGYEAVVIYMAEAFRNLEYLFDASIKIYTPMTQDPLSVGKMEHFTNSVCKKGRRDLMERAERICAKKGDTGWN